MRVPYERRHRYPHMLPADVEIWDRFIDTHPGFFDAVDYDYHVGDGVEVDPDWPPEIQMMAKTLSQRKIDVLGFNDGGLSIVELKPWPGVGAIGQLLSYRELYIKDNPDSIVPELVLITNNIARDIQFLLDKFEITSYIV